MISEVCSWVYHGCVVGLSGVCSLGISWLCSWGLEGITTTNNNDINKAYIHRSKSRLTYSKALLQNIKTALNKFNIVKMWHQV